MGQLFKINILPLDKKLIDGNRGAKLREDFDKNLITISVLYLSQRQ